MSKTPIQMPEKGSYKWQLFSYWSDEYRQTRADHSAYIALNFAGALDVCRTKLQKLLQHHRRSVRHLRVPKIWERKRCRHTR